MEDEDGDELGGTFADGAVTGAIRADMLELLSPCGSEVDTNVNVITTGLLPDGRASSGCELLNASRADCSAAGLFGELRIVTFCTEPSVLTVAASVTLFLPSASKVFHLESTRFCSFPR